MMRVMRSFLCRGVWAVVSAMACVVGLLSLIPVGASASTTSAPVVSPVVPWSPSPAVPSPAFEAAQSGQRVEIPADRTQTSSTYVTPDGNYQTVVSAGSLNYLGASGYQPIDDTLVADPTAGYAVANKANSYRVEFPSSLGSAPVKVSVGAAWVAFSLNGATAAPSSSTGTSATYANALAGVSVNYQAEPDSVKETLVLASAATPPSYAFSVSASNGVSLAADGDQITLSQGGGPLGVLQAPTMTDADGASGPVSMSLAANATGWTVTVTPDAGWLAAASRVFPVRIDPTVMMSASSVCWIDSFSPTIHECSGGSLTESGEIPQGGGGSPPVYAVHGLVNFALPSTIPNDAVVTSAAVTATVAYTYGTNTVNLRRITQAWNPTQVTWNIPSTGGTWPVGGAYDNSTPKYTGPTYTSGTVPASGTVSWEPTQLVQDWLNYRGTSATGANNFGVLLAQTSMTNPGQQQFDPLTMTINWAYRWGPTGSIHLNNLSLNDKATLGVQVANDNAVLSNSDLSIAGTGENLTVDRYYNSAGLTGGSAWSFSVGPDVKVTADTSGTIVAKEPGGAQVSYAPSASVTGHCVYAGTTYSSMYVTPPGADATLCSVAPGTGRPNLGYVLTSNSSQSSLFFGGFTNAGTNLTQQIDRNADTISYGYNTSNQLISMTDTQGRTFTVTPDPTTGKISQITGPVGATGAQFRTWGYSWATNGQLNYYTDPTGQVTHYSYDTNGNLSKVLSPGTYVSGTLTASETDIAQSAGGQVTSVTRKDPSCTAGSCTTTYATLSAPQPVASGANRCANYPVPNTTPAIGNSGPTSMIGCATVTDPNTHTTSYGWDISDQVVKTIDGLNQASSDTYNPDNHNTNSYDNSGNMAAASYDSNNNQTTGSAPASGSTQTAAMSDAIYSTSSTPAVMGPAGSTIPGNQYLASTGTDPNNNCGTNAYDSNGNVTTAWSGLTGTGTGATRTCTTPGGAPTGSQEKVVKTYTGDAGATGCTGHNGQLCTSTDGNGGVTHYAYNTNGQLLTVTPPTPQSPTTYTYDANGREATVTDGAGRVTTYSYDADDRRTQITASNGTATPVSTDGTVTQNGNNTVTATGLSTTHPGDLIVAFVSSGGPTAPLSATVSGAGLTWSLAARSNGQSGDDAEIWTATAPTVLSSVSVTSTQTSSGYDQSLTVIAFAGATGIGATATAGNDTGDPSVSLTPTVTGSVVYAAGMDYYSNVAHTPTTGQTLVEQWVDNGWGNTMWTQTVTATQTAGIPVTISDTAPNYDSYDLAAIEIVPATTNTVSYTYDPNGNLISQIDSSGTTTKNYSQLNQLAAEYLPAATGTWTCAGTVDSGLHYTYDQAGNLASYCDQGGTVTYVYDADNHNTGVADPGGNCTPGTVIQPCTTFAYSPSGKRITVTDPTSTGVSTAMTYDGYNNSGNQLSVVTSKSGTPFINLTYTYTKPGSSTTDTALRQTAVDHISGVTTTYNYTPQVQLQCAGTAGACSTAGYKYAYDSDGNMTSQTVNGTATSYTYNAADELTTGSAAYNGAGDQTATNTGTALAYNSLAQTTTIGTTNNTYSGAGQNGLTATGATTLQNSSILGVTAITTSGVTSNITRDANGNLVTIRNAGASYYYLVDAQNSVIGLINSTGTRVGTYTYDPYGNLTNTPATGIATTNPFRYDSGYQTPNGLYHYGARYYNPTLGAWTQLDPTGQNPGYNYANDNPVNEADPSGTGVTGSPCANAYSTQAEKAAYGCGYGGVSLEQGLGLVTAGLTYTAGAFASVAAIGEGFAAGGTLFDLGLGIAAFGPLGAAGVAGSLILAGTFGGFG